MSGTEWSDGKGEPSAGNAGQAGQDEREFEAALACALRRVNAPEDFAARVVALAEAEQRTAGVSLMAVERSAWWRFSIGWKPVWGGAAALLVAGVLTGHVVREHRADEQAKVQTRAQASREFDTAVQITDRTLDHAMEQAQEQLRRKGVPVDADGQ